MTKIKKTWDEFVHDLNDQINCIEDSVNSYLDGKTYESKRVATALRILLHDTENSTSLLTHLELKDKLYFLDNAEPYSETNLLNSNLLLNMRLSPIAKEFVPRLEVIRENAKWIKFDSWWEQPVVTFNVNKNYFSRKNIVIILANQDGGAHIDKKVNEDYYNLTRRNGQKWYLSINGKEISVSNDCFEKTIISIAFEVIYMMHTQLNKDYIHVHCIETHERKIY